MDKKIMCPFCKSTDSKNFLAVSTKAIFEPIGYTVCCTNCHCRGPIGNTPEEAYDNFMSYLKNLNNYKTKFIGGDNNA